MVAKRQGREKHKKIEQRKVKGRSEDHQSEDLRYNKQHSWLSPICIGQAQVEEKIYKRRSQSAFFLSLSLPTVGMHSFSLTLSLPAVFLSFSFSLFLSLSLSLPCALEHSSTLFSSRLWVGMPSHFEDGFSCYLLNKIEL